jgi:tRNA G18 (ribose-2'-O)-methylase SpoU
VTIDVYFLTESALDDPRLADYRDLRDGRNGRGNDLGEASGRFIAESEMVVRKLLASRLRVCSLLVTAPRLAALESALLAADRRMPVYVVPQNVMDQVAGFHVHRGCLAIAERPVHARLPDDARLVVVLVDLVDVDNLGTMARNAAAFGADALLLSPRCADPFYRKAVRTSVGAVLSLPIVRATHWPADLLALRERPGFRLVGAVVGQHAQPLASFQPPPRLALLFGAEGPGLDPPTQELCDALVTVPMAASHGVDSLNVSAAGAVFLYHCTQGTRREGGAARLSAT